MPRMAAEYILIKEVEPYEIVTSSPFLRMKIPILYVHANSMTHAKSFWCAEMP